jgi:tRNA-dihydrouridine synthase
MPWKIGDISVDGPVVSGPMSGYTSRSYRDFMKPFGVAVSMTEMTSAVGILNSDAKTGDYVMFDRNYPTGLQLFGHSADDIAKAAAKALKWNPNIDFFDINMGCPVPKVLRSGSGSALMSDPGRCGEIVRAVKTATGMPVTIKTRLGKSLESINFREILDATISAGADAVAIHARTVKERYTGQPHYDMVEGLQKELAVPLIISGNIYSLGDAI